MIRLNYRKTMLLIIIFLAAIVFCMHYILTPSSLRGIRNILEKRYHQSNWPMKIIKGSTFYELRLETNVDEGHNVENFTSISNIYVYENVSMFQNLTFQDLIRIPDSLWKSSPHPNIFKIYPQPYNLTQIFNNLLHRQPIPVTPINGAIFRFPTISKEVCHPNIPDSQSFDLVIVVRSSIGNFHRRQEFRNLYASFTNKNANSNLGIRTGMVFFMGLPRTQMNNVFNRAGHVIHMNINGGNQLNPKDIKMITEKFKKECSEHNDLVVGDFEDTYFNLTIKSIYSFEWAAAFCQASRPVILFIDDDVPISLKEFTRVILSMGTEEREALHHGKLLLNMPVRRFSSFFSKYAVDKSEVPWTVYPPYTAGALLFAGFSEVEKIAIGMLFTRTMPIEDTFTGTVSIRMNLQPKSIYDLIGTTHIFTRRKHNLQSVEKYLLSVKP